MSNLKPLFFALSFAAQLIMTSPLVSLSDFFLLVLYIGGPIYVLVGLPVAVNHLRHYDADVIRIVGLALMADGILFLISLPLMLLGLPGFILLVASLCGFVIAPIWAAIFGSIYIGLCDAFYSHIPRGDRARHHN